MAALGLELDYMAAYGLELEYVPATNPANYMFFFLTRPFPHIFYHWILINQVGDECIETACKLPDSLRPYL